MASRQSKLEAERLAILQQSAPRGRSTSPSRARGDNTSSSPSREDQELKWSITNHDPLERLVDDKRVEEVGGTNSIEEEEPSEEEHISDDDDNEKFLYDDTGNILPNYACGDEKIDEVSAILEKSNLNDQLTVKRLEELTANERALANAHKVGTPVDDDLLRKLESSKQELTGLEKLDLLTSMQDQDARRTKLEAYARYRKKIIEEDMKQSGQHASGGELQHSQLDSSTTAANAAGGAAPGGGESSADHADTEDFMVPYTSAVEDKLDSLFAYQLNETIREGPIDSTKSQSRVIQTITRGNFFQLINPEVKPKMFLVCMDFLPESIFALEWCLGTVLVDGLVLFIVCVIEENDANHHLKGNSLNESTREKYRLDMLNKARQQVLNLLKLTKLQIHIVIEIIHHPIPRHLILEFIDNLQPTLVVVGSKGQSAIKGVLLGLLSNYLVTKLSVPVMVVREKLKKINRFKNGSLVFSNNIKPLTLSEARVD